MQTFRNKHDSLYRLVTMTCALRCSDARDQIYGLLGLTRQTHIQLNYEVPIHMCMRDATLAMLEEEGNLEPLIFKNDVPSKHAGGHDNHWPSWAVRWHELSKDWRLRSENHHKYCVSSDKTMDIDFLAKNHRPEVLVARGFSLDTVLAVF